jgi:hypothetical protein
MALPPRATRPCRQRCSPAAVPHCSKDLTPWGTATGAVVRHGGRPWGRTTDIYFSNFWLVHLFFENQRKKYKKIASCMYSN